jgi:hypothetical protein
MKYHHILITVFLLAIVAIIGLFSVGDRHENVIIGEWKEVQWIYEGQDNTESSGFKKQAASEMNKKIGRDFFMHEDEIWEFNPNGTMTTRSAKNGDEHNLRWVIKGRGNILVLKDGSTPIEYYNITTLNEDSMVLYFDLDLQAKGVAELRFKKVNQ